MPDAERMILRLLSAVSDGTEVDWASEETRATDEAERSAIRSLRIVAGIADYHRGADLEPALAPGRRLGHLEVIACVGRGSFGAVYRVLDHRLEREAALKLFPDPAWSEEGAHGGVPRFLEEARRLARVRHPNVVAIHAVESITLPEGAAVPGIVMEYVRGRGLDEIVRAHGPLGAHEISAIGIEICRALAAVHGAGLVHQDLKPQNVMREEGGRLVLMDFGPGGATPATMAPEILGADPATARTDLYSLGAVLFFLASGSYPVRGRNRQEMRAALAAGDRRRLRDERPDLPSRLVQVIERALETDPDSRFASAGEMEAALGTAGHSGRRRRGAASWAAAALILIALGAVLWRSRPAAEQARREGASPPPIALEAPAATAPSGVAGAPAAGVYTVEAAFYRGRQQRERLDNGARIAPGDSISLRIHASAPLFVYVINQDDANHAFLLFPAAGYAAANPVLAGTAAILPGTRDGRAVYWQVTSAGGRERLLVVTSERRLDALEAEIENLARPRPDEPVTYARIPARAVEELRGLGGYVEEEASPAEAAAASAQNFTTGRQLFELAAVLTGGPESARGVWIRRLELENPGR